MRAKPARTSRRSRPLRIESNDVVWFVTCRVIEERFWLHPLLASGLRPRNRAARRNLAHLERHFDKRLARYVARANRHRGPYQPKLTLQDAKRIARGLVGSALARAQATHKVRLFGFVAMSNHLHALVRTRGKNLAAFMRDVKARITEAINLLTGKRGPLWSRRYDAQACVDDQGACDRQGYLLDNPRKANLIDRPLHWPGLNLAFGLADHDRLDFEYLDRTAWHAARRPDNLAPFFRTATLELSPLPACEGLSREACRDSARAWIEHAHAKAEANKTDEQRQRRRRPLGIDKLIHTDFEARPASPDRSRRPYVFGHPDACKRYTAGAIVLSQEHAELSRRYRKGERMLRFPDGMYPPPLIQAA